MLIFINHTKQSGLPVLRKVLTKRLITDVELLLSSETRDHFFAPMLQIDFNE